MRRARSRARWLAPIEMSDVITTLAPARARNSASMPEPPHTVKTERELRDSIATVRKQGFAMVDQELEEGLRSAAVPIRSASGNITAALNVSVQRAFRTRDSDFLVSDNTDFHPTDVLEDADGSLLVVDTGGWYKICCPTSQLWKPDVLGAIYRVRRKGAPRLEDPRGLKLPWATMKPAGP